MAAGVDLAPHINIQLVEPHEGAYRIRRRERMRALNLSKILKHQREAFRVNQRRRIAPRRRHGILTHGDLVRELSSEEMKAAQETALRVKVSDVNALARVLVAKDIRHRILDADTADIYGKPQITELVMALAKEGCDVLELEERTERAENLLDALGGGKV